MFQKPNQNKKTKSSQKNPLEALLDPIFGNYPDRDRVQEYGEHGEEPTEKPVKKLPHRKETIFNFREHYERENVQREVRRLLEAIKQEAVAAKKAGSDLSQEIQEVEKMTVETLPPTPGIYHVRFLEVVFSLIRTIRLKIGESKTWLEAMVSKKKKRGSLFMVRSKRMGTQYSLSQELQSARSVQ